MLISYFHKLIRN